MPEDTESSKNSGGEREGTYRSIVQALKKNPAYLLMFSIGLLGGGMGVGTIAVGFYRENTTFMFLGFASWALLVVATILVVVMVERPRQRRSSMLDLLDDKARESFHAGADATELSGEWEVQWFEGEGPSRIPYAPDPREEITVSTFRSGLCCTAVDESTRKRYWLLGRVSTRQCVPMLYWSQKGETTEALTGVILLKREETGIGSRRFKGLWTGFTRNGAITRGECEWTQRI